jgi:hypothetical protein
VLLLSGSQIFKKGKGYSRGQVRRCWDGVFQTETTMWQSRETVGICEHSVVRGEGTETGNLML